MLQTKIYDQSNAIITGSYHRYNGDCVEVEYVGSALECECYINGVRQDDDGRNEVQHVLTYDKIKYVTPVYTGFALHNVWLASVPQTM
jgi:hypothetical protein